MVTSLNSSFIKLPARDLKPGMTLVSLSGSVMTVTGVNKKNYRIIVLFDGDREIDFKEGQELKVYLPNKPALAVNN